MTRKQFTLRIIAATFIVWHATRLAPGQVCPDGVCPQPPPWQQTAPQRASAALDTRLTQAIVRVRNQTAGGATIGTGTLIAKADGQGVILTCAHLFREGQGRLEVVFPDGQHFVAQVLAIDQPRDLSALAIAAPSATPISVSRRAPTNGEPLWSSGYGGNDRLWTNHGQALRLVSVQGGPVNAAIELSGSARSGDSGGPIFNQQGELAGVIFGTNGQVVDGTHCVEVCQFLEKLRDRLAPRVAEGNKPAPPPMVDLGPAPRADAEMPSMRGELDRKDALIAGLRARLDDLLAKPNVIGDVDVSPMPAGPISKAANAAGSAWLAGLLVSFGIPGGVAATVAGGAVWLVMRRGKKRLQAQLTRARGAASTALDNTDSPLLERHHNQYVAYEVSALDKAWAAAHAHVGQKYPGAVPYLKIAEGVKDQLVSGQ